MSKPNPRCLLVEPNQAVADATTPALRNLGFDAESLGNLDEAFEVCVRDKPGLVIVDTAFGEDTVDNFLVEARAQLGDEVKFLVTTTGSAVGEKAWKESGAEGLLTKPIRLAGLAAKLREIGFDVKS